MKERKRAILSAIIKEHVHGDGKPVASQALVDKYKLELSSATVRNEMADLESEGLIFQPHTSAGRIPTEKGWQYYIENFLVEKQPAQAQMTLLEKALHKREQAQTDVAVKNVARTLAEISQNAVFVGFSRDNVYYTGLSNLFNHPEFADIDLVRHLSAIVDHLDDVIAELFSKVTDTPRILVGSENPFGKECSTIFSPYQVKGCEPGLIGVLGPVRMDYEDAFALVNYTKKLFAHA
ncbi:MAG: hypothetical protein ACOYUK_01600 [Patescibacteria group bacterium]